MELERLLEAWVGITGMLKNSRLTSEMSYNESIIMLLAYRQYLEDGVGEIAVKMILEKTKMLKSLANRTLNELANKQMIEKRRDDEDSRRVFIRPTEKGLEEFMVVHTKSLVLVQKMKDIIGEEDAAAIVRVYEKLMDAEKTAQKTNVDKETARKVNVDKETVRKVNVDKETEQKEKGEK